MKRQFDSSGHRRKKKNHCLLLLEVHQHDFCSHPQKFLTILRGYYRNAFDKVSSIEFLSNSHHFISPAAQTEYHTATQYSTELNMPCLMDHIEVSDPLALAR